MRFSLRTALILSSLPAVSSAALEAQDAKAILGVWKGTSICVNRQATPACRDEEVVYEFRETSPPAAGKLTLKADKVVKSEALPMGVLDFVWDPKAGTWSCEIQTRWHGLWSFPPPKDGELTGTLVLLPDKTIVRKATVRR